MDKSNALIAPFSAGDGDIKIKMQEHTTKKPENQFSATKKEHCHIIISPLGKTQALSLGYQCTQATKLRSSIYSTFHLRQRCKRP